MWTPHATIHKGIYFESKRGLVPNAAALERLAVAPLGSYQDLSRNPTDRWMAYRSMGSPQYWYIPPIHWEMHVEELYVIEVTPTIRNKLCEGLPFHPLAYSTLTAINRMCSAANSMVISDMINTAYRVGEKDYAIHPREIMAVPQFGSQIV
jgi:hypothetical protein